MLKIIEFSEPLRVTLNGVMPPLAPELDAEVERLWQAEQGRRNRPLFNGKIFSATDVTSHEIMGQAVDYRYLIAQKSSTNLFNTLQVRPVAVSGVLECLDGLVFGKRAQTTTQDAGLWELVPSGGIDLGTATAPQDIDYRSQILTELHEEIGVEPEMVTNIRAFCVIDDLDTHVLDIGIAMTVKLSGDAILQTHKKVSSDEYSELRIVPRTDIHAFTREQSSKLVEVTEKLIEYYCGHHAPASTA